MGKRISNKKQCQNVWLVRNKREITNEKVASTQKHLTGDLSRVTDLSARVRNLCGYLPENIEKQLMKASHKFLEKLEESREKFARGDKVIPLYDEECKLSHILVNPGDRPAFAIRGTWPDLKTAVDNIISVFSHDQVIVKLFREYWSPIQ